MHSTILAGFLALTAWTTTVAAQYNVSSAPFYLTVKSHNTTLDGRYLEACHEGAAIEGLCLGGAGAPPTVEHSRYQFNSSYYNPAANASGILTYELRGGNFNLSSPMQLTFSPTTNVAVPLFTPSNDVTQVNFLDDELVIVSFFDDTVVPLKTNAQKVFKQWYICETYAGYAYTTLAWVVPGGKPRNPTCQKVNVIRKFA